MDDILLPAAARLLIAACIGGIIGIERAYHGRAAGFRTHILVCVASSLLMLLVQYQWFMVPPEYTDSIRLDPTRMAQGIMTGIGFLGAGVIMQERYIVRGLTTAASIWITSAIGIMVGAGFFSIAMIAGVITLGTLSLFRLIEAKLPVQHYARLKICLVYEDKDNAQQILLNELEAQGLKCSNIGYSMNNDRKTLLINLTVSSFNNHIFERLNLAFNTQSKIKSFSFKPLD